MAKIKTNRIFNVISEALKNKTIVSAQGGSRSGKTYNICIWLIVYLLEHPNIILSIVRKTLPAIKGSVLRDVKEILLNMGVWEDKSFNKTELIYTFSNGSIIEFFSTDDEQKIRGRKRDILFCNEANELLYLDYIQLQMRTTKFTILDYNPSFSDDHWLNGINQSEDTYHFITTYKDNPFLEDTIIKTIEGYKETNLSLWKIYGLGLQSAVEGLVYPAVHEIDQIPYNAVKRALGLDFGFTNHPTACVECAIIQEEYVTNLYINEVFYATHLSNLEIINELKAYRGLEVIADSEDPRTINEIKQAGINIKAVSKPKGSVIGGINKAKSLRISYTKNSSNIKKEFQNYTWQQKKDGTFENVPIKDFDHAMDAFRYYVIYKLMDNKTRGIIIR